MSFTMFDFLWQLIDWIYKKRCYFCKKVSGDTLMCDECFVSIKLLKPIPVKLFEGSKIYCATEYSDKMKTLIRAIKYHNKKSLSFEAGMVLKSFWEKVSDRKQDYVILPMPLYSKRQKKRGYNQSETIAIEFAKHFGYDLNIKLAYRHKQTPPLYKMNAKQRAEVLGGVFKVDADKHNGKAVLIIDDICTTGSSCKELVKELKKNGILDVTVLACCAVNIN